MHTQNNVPEITLNAGQQRLFDMLTKVDRFNPIFVSGSAGTGKTALLMKLKNFWISQRKIVYVTAFTNMAARNINGKTCHSVFAFDFDLNLIVKKTFGVPHYLIIDEISMIPEKMLDGIDSRLRQSSQDSQLPFGGVNVIVFGDLYQLPPVNKNNAQPVFTADLWNLFYLYELKENMRQSEIIYIDNLNLLRLGKKECLPYFNSLAVKNSPSKEETLNCTSLVSTNAEADVINNNCYNIMRCAENELELTCTYNIVNWNKKLAVYNQDQEAAIFKPFIKLCPGTRIIITHNTQGLCNGDTGIIINVTEKVLYIRREFDNALYYLQPIKLYFNTNPFTKVKTVKGFPVKYAWAITIHKAQGLTVKNLIVYPECLFEAGQAYVALSRCVHSDGLKLGGTVPENAIKSMSAITDVYNNMPKLI